MYKAVPTVAAVKMQMETIKQFHISKEVLNLKNLTKEYPLYMESMYLYLIIIIL